MTASVLRAEPRFVRWVVAEGVSMVGTGITTVALPLVVYDATGSAAQTGLLFAFRVVPYLLFGVVAGPLADRGNRRLLVIGGNVVEGLLVATIPLAHLLGVLTVAQVYVVALLSATAFVFSDAAVFGAVPALVGPAQLPAANGLLSSITSASEIVGPVLAGILVATVGAAGAVAIDAASFLVAAAVQSTIRSSFRERTAAPPERTTLRAGARAAFRFIRSERVVATLFGVGFGNSFAFGAVLGLLVPYAVEVLSLDADDGRVGVLFGAVGVGSLLAGLVFSRIFTPGRIKFLTPGTLAASGGLALALALNSAFLAGVALVGAFAASMTTTIVTGITYRQLVAPDHLRSSVNVIGRMISWGGQPFGAAVGGIVASATDIPVAYTMSGVVMLVAAALASALLSSVRSPAELG